MNQLIGIVKSIIGQVFALTPEGTRRLLVEGDRLYQGEQILTGPDGMITLELADGRLLDLGRDTQWSSDDQVPVAPASPSDVESVEALQAAIAAGDDPTASLTPTAAGPGAGGAGGAGGGGGSSSVVVLDATGQSVDPTIGYETAGLASASDTSDELTGAPETALLNIAPNSNDLSLTTEEDSAVSGRVEATDANGDTLTFSLTNAPLNGTLVLNTLTGDFTYTPNPDFNGDDSFTLTIDDGQGGVSQSLVTITVAPINDVPLAADDSLQVQEDGVISGNLADNDSPSGDGGNLWTLGSQAANGTAVVNPDGTFSYTPNPDFNGTDSFTYSITDANGDISTATVNIRVVALNDVPVAVDDVLSAVEDSVLSGSLAGNDSPSGDGGNVWALGSQAANGTAVVNADGTFSYTPNPNFNGTDSFTYSITDANGDVSTATVTLNVAALDDVPVAVNDAASVTQDSVLNGSLAGNDTASGDGGNVWALGNAPSNGTVVVNANGTFSYTPDAGFSGSDSFTYTLTDADGDSVTATASITVNPNLPVNTPPVAVADTASTSEDTPVTINVLGNDSDANGDPLTVTAASAANGTVLINVDGTLSYTPNTGFTGNDSISYSISDGQGGSASSTVAVTVGAGVPVNSPPVAVADTASTSEDTPVTINVLGNDSDANGDPLTVTAASAANGTVLINVDGTLSYTPNTGFTGNDSISYSISDGQGGSASSTVAVTVAPANDSPVAVDDLVQATEDTLLTGNLAGNDSPSTDGGNVWALGSQAANGTAVVNADGTFSYTPNPDFNGTDSFTYSLTDADGETSTATVTVNVAPANDAPVAVDDLVQATEDTLLTG
ncbi:MAG: retention module-containing protein, partial [Pseudomonadota bacterium]